MKKLVSLVVGFLLMAAFFCFFTAALAQEPAVAPSPAGTTKKEPAAPVPDQPGIVKRVKVLKGGNLAIIAEGCGHRQTEWLALAAANPNLPKPEKVGDMWRVLVHPGQILNLPAEWSYGTLNPEEVEPAPSRAGGSSIITPIMKIPSPPSEEPRIDATDSNRSLWWMPAWLPGLLVILAVVLVILWLAGVFRNLPAIILSRRRNPRRYPAVVPGGLSNDLTTALAQITAAYPGRTVATRQLVRGHFVNDSGPDRVKVGMTFRDGVDRPAYIRPGDSVYQALLEDGTVEGYYLQACGNAISRFQKPAGWRFVVGESMNISQSATTVPVPSASAAPVPPAPPVPPIPPVPPTPPVPPAPVFPAEPVLQSELAPAPAEPPAPAEESPATKEAALAVETSVVDGLKEVAITITDEKGTILSVAVKGHERALPTKLEKANGKLVVFFHRDTTA